MSSESHGYLSAQDSDALLQELLTTAGFSLEQLIELSGLSVAETVDRVLSNQSLEEPVNDRMKEKKRIILFCGPGTIGGTGLVAARHLEQCGYDFHVVLVTAHDGRQRQQSLAPHYSNLIKTCRQFGVSILKEIPDDLAEYDGIVDSMSEASFEDRSDAEPMTSMLLNMVQAQSQHKIPVISVDVPSSWNDSFDDGEVVTTSSFCPDVLVSLMAPKICCKNFAGRHFCGGRFLPPAIAQKYNISVPAYPQGLTQVVEITRKEVSWEEEYAAYCAAKEAEVAQKEDGENKNPAMEDPESWEDQYHQYCVDKEKEFAKRDAEEAATRKRMEMHYE